MQLHDIGIFVIPVTVIANSILSLIVYTRNPKSAINKIFSLLGLTILLWLVSTYISFTPSSPENALLWIKFSTFFAPPICYLFFLLAYNVPSNKLLLSKNLFISLLAITIIVMLLIISPYTFISVKIINNFPNPAPGPGMLIFVGYVVITIISAIYILIKKFRASKGIVHHQLRLILLGVISMPGLILLTNVLPILFFQNNSLVPFTPLLTFIFLTLIAYAIVKHRFLDIRIIIARTISYALVIGVFGFLYSLLFAAISSIYISFTLESKTIIISTILALIMAFSFQTVRRIIEKITDKFFFKDHYDREKLLYNLTLIMASTLKFEDLSHQLLKEMLLQMRISRGAFILTSEDRIYEVTHEGYETSPVFNEKKILFLQENNQTAIFDELPENELKKVMRELSFSIVFNLRTAGEQIGFLALGEKLSGDIYTSEDIRVLEIFVPEAAVAIKNALAYEEIRRFNITLKEDIKKATLSLEKANIRLKELDKLKDEFVSIASHELRTPITAIKGYLWMVLNKNKTPVNQEAKKNIEVAYNETDRLIKLVQNMLTISRIEGKRLQMNLETFNVYEIVKHVHDELKIKADEKKIKFTLLPNSAALEINGDKEKTEEIMENIIGNAIKYTPENGRVTVSAAKTGGNAEIKISDTGPGISKEDQGKLFQKFGRLKEGKENRTPGTGLGLYITKQLVTLHKGTIKVDSKVGKGTTFTIILPLA